jgi:spore maturation protein CgeB
VYYGEGYKGYNKNRSTNDVIDQYNDMDIILTYGYRYTLVFGKFAVPDGVKRVHILVDFFPAHSGGYRGSWELYKTFLNDTKFNVLFVRQRVQLDYLKQIGCNIPAYWLPFSVDVSRYKKVNEKKIYDVITSATLRSEVYPNRVKVKGILKQMGLKIISSRIIQDAYIKAINQSKIAVISTNIFNSPNMKFTEFTSCGTFVLTDKPADFDELGFKNGEHLILYKNLDDLKDKVKYYLKHEKEREEIAANGMNFVHNYHNNGIRVEQFIKAIKKELYNDC